MDGHRFSDVYVFHVQVCVIRDIQAGIGMHQRGLSKQSFNQKFLVSLMPN